MTAALLKYQKQPHKHVSNTTCGQVVRLHPKNPAQSNDYVMASRRVFVSMLWAAFPSRSESDLAFKAARALDVSRRQVQNWLRCEHSPAFHHVTAVMQFGGYQIIKRAGQ